jgi:hypothetical protein
VSNFFSSLLQLACRCALARAARCGTMADMMKPADEKNLWLVLIVTVLVSSLPAIASNHAVLLLGTHAELSAAKRPFNTEQAALTPETATSYYDPFREVASDSPVAPKRVDWLADSMNGWKNGEVIPGSVLKRLSSRLNRNNVSIIPNEWALEILEKSGDRAQFVRFKDGSAGLLLRPNATRYQVVHELKHYEHWLADPTKYGTLNKLEREEYVFKALQESSHWRRFNDAERTHALEYIEYLRRLYGN